MDTRLRTLTDRSPERALTSDAQPAGTASRRMEPASGLTPLGASSSAASERPRVELPTQAMHRFDAARSAEIENELEGLRTAPPHTSLRPEQRPLAAYLTARVVDGRRVEGEDLERLQKGNDAVNAARNHLPGGRSNVQGDILQSDGRSYRQGLAGRELSFDLARAENRERDSADIAAGARLAGAGFCGGFARVTQTELAARIGADETVNVIQARGIDHQFTEIRPPGGREHAVVADAWASGPAIFAPDGKFSHGRKTPQSVVTLTSADGQAHVERVEARLETLSTDFANALQQRLQTLEEEQATIPQEAMFRESTVVSTKFRERVARKMDEPADPSRAKPRSTLRKALERLKKPAKPADPLIPLRNEVRAAGVLRTLGHNVATATANAPDVVAIARRLGP